MVKVNFFHTKGNTGMANLGDGNAFRGQIFKVIKAGRISEESLILKLSPDGTLDEKVMKEVKKLIDDGFVKIDMVGGDKFYEVA
ncbi:MAG: hypothetical protein QXU98_06905 [Candidatus Parvarchaeota archaeon]